MKRSMILLSATAALLLVAAALPVLAQSGGGGYDLSWWTVDGGGDTPNDGSGYSLGGTVGQPDAAQWTNSHYTLLGGFWGGTAIQYRIYLPLVLRAFP